jgi:hypothetical protein
MPFPIKNKPLPIEKNEFFKFNIKKQDIKPELSSNLEKPKKVKKKDEDIQENKLKMFV